MKTEGSHVEVYHRTAKHTSGELTKWDLKWNKRDEIVSIKACNNTKNNNQLVKSGYKTKKGEFTLFK